MANLGQLTLDLVARTGSFTGPLDKAGRESKKHMKQIATSANQAKLAMDSLGAAFSIGAVAYFTADIVKAGMAVEGINRQFAVLAGNADLGGRELQFVRETANSLGMDMQGLTATYGRFMSSVKGTANEGQAGRDAFIGLSEGMVAVGLSADEQNRVWAQLSQGIMKGKFEMEDLKTVQEAGLPIMKLMADSLGITTEELLDMQKKGSLLVEDVLPKLGASMHETFGVSAKEAAASAQGELSRFNNAMLEAKQIAGKALLPVFTDIVRFATPAIESLAKVTQSIQILGIRLAANAAKRGVAWDNLVSGRGVFSKEGLEIQQKAADDADKLAEEMIESILKGSNASTSAYTKQEESVQKLIKSTPKLTKVVKEQKNAFDEQIKALKLQLETFGMTDTESKLWEMDTKGATDAQLLAAEAIYTKIDALNLEKAAIISSSEAEKKANEERIEQNKKLQAFATNYSSLLKSDQSGLSSSLIGSGSSDTAKKQMQEKLSIQQKYNEELSKLTEQFTTGDITQSLYEQESQIVRDALATRLEMQEEYYTQLSELQGNAALGASEALANYMDNAKNYSEIAKSFVNEQLGAMESGLSKALYNMITETQSLGDAFKTLGKSMADSMINALTDIAAKFLITQAMQLMFGKTAQLSAVATMTANAQATSLQAGIAAFASTAAIPIVGPLAAPGAMAAALAATQPVAAAVSTAALSGMAHSGIDSIPQDGTWLLKKGERVSTAETSAKLDRTLEDVSKKSSGGDAPIINMYEDKSKAGTVETRTQDDRRIIDIFVADLMGDGKAQKAVSLKFGLQTVGA